MSRGLGYGGMDVADCGTANGTDVRRWSWLNNNRRQWRLVPTTA